MLKSHRSLLEQQREDIEAQLKEVIAFEGQCNKRLAEGKSGTRKAA